jgi:hypothetical protein
MNLAKAAVSVAVAAAGLAMSQPAAAATVNKNVFLDPSASCQLSIPTTDTSVRPRATGFRNEGSTNAFVICGLGDIGAGTGNEQWLQIQFLSFDGAPHTFNCTAVNRQSSGDGPVYNTKPVTATGAATSLFFDGAELNHFAGFANSITCILPPGVAITGLRMNFNDDVGL